MTNHSAQFQCAVNGLEGCNLPGWPLNLWHLLLWLVICLSSLSTALQHFYRQIRCSEHKGAPHSSVDELLLYPYTVAHLMELNPSVSILAGVSSTVMQIALHYGPFISSAVRLWCFTISRRLWLTLACFVRSASVPLFNGTYRPRPQSTL